MDLDGADAPGDIGLERWSTPSSGPGPDLGLIKERTMRSTLHAMALASLFAVGNTSGLGLASARACDHATGGTYARSASWGYRAEFRQPTPAQFVAMPRHDQCAICHPAPPNCAPLPPPCENVSFVVRDSRRVTSSRYSRDSYDAGYASPQALPADRESYGISHETPDVDLTPRAIRPDRPRTYVAGPDLPYPTKQAPSVYATPQGSTYATPPASNPELSLDELPSDAVPPPPFVTNTPPPLPTPYQPYLSQGPQS